MMEIDSDSDRSLLGTKKEPKKKEKKDTNLSQPRVKSKKTKKDSKPPKKIRKRKVPAAKKPKKWHCPDGEERITFLNYLKGWF